MSIVDTILSYLPKRRKTPKGWQKFNAVCCSYNGESPDTRERGGILVHGDGLTYHCFNCGFKAGYSPGNLLSGKFRALMDYLNIPADVKLRISHEALSLREFSEAPRVLHNKFSKFVIFEDKDLPEGSILIPEVPTTNEEIAAVDFLKSRGFTVTDFPFFISKKVPDRVIFPYLYNNKLVGHVARKISPGKPKYLGDEQAGYLFNIDSVDNYKVVIVVEGPFDALSVNGIALLGAGITDEQVSVLARLRDKNIIVVPDRDANGRMTVDRVLEINSQLDVNWKISFPDWDPDIKDSNEAMLKYGKLYTIKSILDKALSEQFRIEVAAKFWFPKEELKKYDNKTKY